MSPRNTPFLRSVATLIVLLVVGNCNASETKKVDHRRLMMCEDTDDPVTYKWKNSFRVKFCEELARLQGTGGRRETICMQELFFDDKATVRDVCPKACGACTDSTSTPFFYERKNSKIRTTTCAKLTRKVDRGGSIANICVLNVVSNGGSKTGKTVSQMCPDACGDDGTPPTPPPPTDGNNKKGKGKWAKDIFEMEVIPIHAILTPGGTVLGYGTNPNGEQGAGAHYTVWDPRMGVSTKAHYLYGHKTGKDIFCSNLNIDPSTGNIITMGGDTRDGNAYGIKNALEFDYKTQKMYAHPLGDMNRGRWYPTSITLPDGRIFVAGGREGNAKGGEAVPEVWDPEDGFKLLQGARTPLMATNDDGRNWWYPPCFVNSLAEIICIPYGNGKNLPILKYSVDGNGDVTEIGTKPFRSMQRAPSIMYRMNKVVMLDNDGALWVTDISYKNPTFKKVNELGHPRFNGMMVMLPDGCVAIFGGNRNVGNGGNTLNSAVYTVQIWDPETNTVYTGPEQERARLYHSIALILQDGTVVSAGGGAPGPQKNRNGQIYYPYYFFKKNGELADRPEIASCPKNTYSKDYKPNKYSGSGSFEMDVDNASRIQKITATKSGSSSHSRNCDTRWINLAFETKGNNKVTVHLENKNVMNGGLWLINIIDVDGVPSKACMTGINMDVKLLIE